MVKILSPAAMDVADAGRTGVDELTSACLQASDPKSLLPVAGGDPDKYRQQDHHEQDWENADHHRQGEPDRQAVSLFLGAREPLVAHVVAVDPKRIGDARA